MKTSEHVRYARRILNKLGLRLHVRSSVTRMPPDPRTFDDALHKDGQVWVLSDPKSFIPILWHEVGHALYASENIRKYGFNWRTAALEEDVLSGYIEDHACANMRAVMKALDMPMEAVWHSVSYTNDLSQTLVYDGYLMKWTDWVSYLIDKVGDSDWSKSPKLPQEEYDKMSLVWPSDYMRRKAQRLVKSLDAQ